MQVPLTQGYEATVDDADAPLIAGHSWCAHKCGGRVKRIYAATNIDGRTVHMHRLILDVDGEVDHIDGDGLNNRRANLRPATRQQNQANSGARSGKYKGVSKHGQVDRWVARIRVNGAMRYLGIFEDPVEAAKVYDAAAEEAWGDFAFLNFPRR